LRKALSDVHISLFAQHTINEIAISIDGSIEITPFSLRERFIQTLAFAA